MKDYANLDGNKNKRIMKGGKNEFFQFPNGIIKTGGE